MKQTALKRKTPLGRGKPMRRKRRKREPLATERRRWERVRALGCLACRQEFARGGVMTGMAVEIHHVTSRGRIIGHEAVAPLCHYHHQAKFLPGDFVSYTEAARVFGPSLEREPKWFASRYGDGGALLAEVDMRLGASPGGTA